MKPYKDQDKLIKKISKAFKQGKKHVLAASPTGSGKTVMFSFITKITTENKRKKVLILTDRNELLTQAGGTIEKFNLDPSYIKAGVKFIDKSKNVYIAMSQTLRRRIKDPKWIKFITKDIDLIIIDECHIQEFNYLFENDFLKDNYVLGFTATPVRTGKMVQLATQYDTIVHGATIRKLIKKRRLVNCDIYDCGSPDMSKVKINASNGDYSENSMYEKFNSNTIYKGLVKNYLKLVPNQKMIVFCVNVEHAIKTTKKLNKAGIKAKFVASKKTPPREPRNWTDASTEIFKNKQKAYKLYQKNVYKHSGPRDKIFEDFKTGAITVLVNVDIATKGFDAPDLKVVALCRATTSLALYLQMAGRGGRTSPGKTHFTMLDFGGNKERFGPYDLDRDWTLWHKESPGVGIAPMKICGEDSKMLKIKGASKVKDGCERLILASYNICPFCGFKYPKKDKGKEIELALAEVIDEQGISIKDKSFKDMSFSELHKYREIKKHSMAWLWHQLWARNKEKTIEEFGKKYHWKQSSIRRAILHCSKFN